MRRFRFAASLLALCSVCYAAHVAPAVAKYLEYPQDSVILLEHVRVIDGTGAAPMEGEYVLLAHGKIAYMGHTAPTSGEAPTVRLDMTGRTIFPGIVGMHDHLYTIARPDADAERHSEPPLLLPQMSFSAPRMYLASGVTTIRTTGSVEPYTDLNLRRDIDAGKLPGPHMDVTAPYLEGPGSPFIQMHSLSGPEEARQMVDYWASQGATSFKAYMHITRAELKAAIDEAHKKGLKVTGHLCSVTYPEAAEMGIDDLEHGFVVNTQLDPGKQPDLCPRTSGRPTLEAMDPDGPQAKALIQLLVSHHVAITSTLPVFEGIGDGRPPLQQRILNMMTPETREAYLYTRNLQSNPLTTDADPNGAMPRNGAQRAKDFRRAEELERRFVAAGGLLIAGPDPTGDGHTLPGFGDQREIELLVEAGFTPEQAIQIATLNGAIYLKRQDHIGSIAVGKDADLVVVKGDPSTHITDIENVETVFKDGLAFDSKKLLDSVKGRYGEY